MRRPGACFIVLVAGCGRIGFADEVADAPASDRPSAARACTPSVVAGYDLGVTGVRDLAVAVVPDGFAVGVVIAPSSKLLGVHLDDALTPNAATPFETSPAAGSPLLYTNVAMQWDGTHLVGEVTVDDGAQMYLKTFNPDMTTFLTADQEVGASATIARPGFAFAGAQPFAMWVIDQNLEMIAIGSDARPVGPQLPISTPNVAIEAPSLASGPAAGATYALLDGTCEISGVVPSLGSSSRQLAPVCRHPQTLAAPPDHMVTVYERGTRIARTDAILTVANSSVMIALSAETDLVAGTAPRIARTTSAVWMAWLDGGLHLGTIDAAVAEAPLPGLPASAPDAFDLVAVGDTTYAFAVYGSRVWAITCP